MTDGQAESRYQRVLEDRRRRVEWAAAELKAAEEDLANYIKGKETAIAFYKFLP